MKALLIIDSINCPDFLKALRDLGRETREAANSRSTNIRCKHCKLTTVTTALSPERKVRCSRSMEEVKSKSIDECKSDNVDHKDSFYLPVSRSENCLDKEVSADVLRYDNSVIQNTDGSDCRSNLVKALINVEEGKKVNEYTVEQGISAIEIEMKPISNEVSRNMSGTTDQKARPDSVKSAENIIEVFPAERQDALSVNNKNMESIKYCAPKHCKSNFKRNSPFMRTEGGKILDRYFPS